MRKRGPVTKTAATIDCALFPPTELFLQPDDVEQLKHYPRITCSSQPEDGAGASNCGTESLPDVAMDGAADPAGRLKRFIQEFHGRILICR